MNNFCICTLTDNRPDRALALKYTVKTFLDNWKGGSFEWFILVNLTNPEIDVVLRDIQEEYSSIKWNITINGVNTGPGGGINKLNKLSKNYEYSLFIEGDWITIPNGTSGISDEWVQNSIRLFEEYPELDQIQYRRYIDDVDDRMYGFAHSIRGANIKEKIHNGDTFFILNNREYVNTPSMRRMSSFHEKGIFPLDEFYDKDGNPTEIKGNSDWGMAEINATRKSMNAAWLEYGNFLHFEDWPFIDDWNDWYNKNFGCGQKFRGRTPCKYGFMSPNIFYCAACSHNEGIGDITKHNERYISHFLEHYKNPESTDEEVLNTIKQYIENPKINSVDQLDINSKRERFRK